MQGTMVQSPLPIFKKVLKFIIYDDYSDIKIKIGRNGVWKRIF